MLSEIYGRPLEPGEPLGKSGLVYAPSMDIHDPSKLQAFMSSPRHYFFSHILGWQSEGENIHFGFGSAWHDAMEHLFWSLNTDDPYGVNAVSEAFDLFMHRFTEDVTDADLLDHASKNPGNALQALAEYAGAWKRSDRKLQTLHTEVAFSVPVAENRVVHGKMDTIVMDRDTGFVKSIEHKTTQRDVKTWAQQWYVILQPLVYQYALECIYEEERVRGVTINGAILRKKGNEFPRFPVRKNAAAVKAGIWHVNHWMDQAKWSMENMLETSPDDDVMHAYPCNGTSCMKSFYGCPFAELCEAWPNPLQHIDRMPPGFKQDYWDPRRELVDAKAVVHIDEGDTDIHENKPEV